MTSIEIVAELEHAVVERCRVGALSYSLMLNFMRPTREKSYLRGSKNMPWKSCVAVSRVGGSPGRSLR